MASGKELRRRIQSVKNTQQITKAMKMVSAAKLRRSQDGIVQARPYANAIREVTRLITGNPSLREGHPLLVKREVKKVCVVLITSDRGLCGGYNSNLNKRAERIYREEAKKYEKLVFACIGKRGYEFLRLRKIPVHKYYEGIQKTLSFAKASAITEELVAAFLSGEFDEIRVVYAEFKSALSQIVVQETMLPISTDAESAAAAMKSDFIFEPSQLEILNEMLPRYFKTLLFRALLEAAASEHGARMAAMDSATRNAGEVIRKLRLIYNNVRQANITKELLEITSGAEAL